MLPSAVYFLTMPYFKMVRTSLCCLLVLWGGLQELCGAAPVACRWYPSAAYEGVSLLCTGHHLTGPPRLLPDSLQWLQLQRTGLSTLDSLTFQWRRLPRLSRLSISGGELSRVERGALCSLPMLAALDLSNNRLSELDASSFECNSQLQRVDLSGNPTLREMPQLSSSSLVSMDVQRCRIADVETSALEHLPNLRVLYLDGNLGLDCSAVRKKLSRKYATLTVICGDESQTSSTRRAVTAARHQTRTPLRAIQALPLMAAPLTTTAPLQLRTQETITPKTEATSLSVTSNSGYETDSEHILKGAVEKTTMLLSEGQAGSESEQFTETPATEKVRSIEKVSVPKHSIEHSTIVFNLLEMEVDMEGRPTAQFIQAEDMETYHSAKYMGHIPNNVEENIKQSEVGDDSLSTEIRLVGKERNNAPTALALDYVDKYFLYCMSTLFSLILFLSGVIIVSKRIKTVKGHYVIPSV